MASVKFALHVLMFNCQDTIVGMLDNCGPFVDRIYVAYSRHPWKYNAKARNDVTNTTDKEIIKQSKYYGKIELIEGQWDYDEDQRNACLSKAKHDGFDYLIIQDADEFYHPQDYRKNIEEIKANPGYEIYRTPWYCFWKNLNYVVVNETGAPIVGYPEFAVNCKTDVKFVRARTTDARKEYTLPGLCYHLSYVMPDEALWLKINTWSHSHQFDVKRWYRRKWLKWNESVKDLHPVDPPSWSRAVKFEGRLPPELEGRFSNQGEAYRPGRWEIFENCREGAADFSAAAGRKMRGLMRRIKSLMRPERQP